MTTSDPVTHSFGETRGEVRGYAPHLVADGERRISVLFPEPDQWPDDEPFVDVQGIVDDVEPALIANQGVLLIGPPGTGKTSAVRSIAESWQSPVWVLQGHSELSPLDMAVKLRLDPDPDARLLASPVVAAMYFGGILLIDEIGRIPDRAFALFAAIGDSRRVIECDAAAFRLRRVHPRFRIVATANTADRLSPWILSRFQVRIDVPPPNAEQLMRIVAVHFAASGYGDLLDAFRAWGRGRRDLSPRTAIAVIRWAAARRQLLSQRQRPAAPARALIEEASALIVNEAA